MLLSFLRHITKPLINTIKSKQKYTQYSWGTISWHKYDKIYNILKP